MKVRNSPEEVGAHSVLCIARIWILTLGSLILPGLTGCAYMGNWLHNGFKVGPDYSQPNVKVADEWIDVNNPRMIREVNAVDEVDWWQSFNDPILNDLVITACRQNLPLRVAGLRVLEAEAQRAIAEGTLFPQYQQAFGNFQQTQRSPTGFSRSIPGTVRSLGVWSTGLRASWELDIWGRFRRRIESADALLDASINNYDDVLVTLIADTAATYIEIRTIQQRLRRIQDNISMLTTSLEMAEDRHKSGIVTKLDVTQAQSTLHQTKALMPVLERGLRQANNRLCVLLGEPPHDLPKTWGDRGEQTIPEPPKHVVVGIPADLIRRRPDVNRAERKLAAQSALIGVAASDLFPMFTIDGSIGWQSTEMDELFTPATNAGFIKPGFNWNIFNYGRIVSNIAVQDTRFQQLAALYQQAVLKANREVEDAVIGFLRSHDRVEALQKAFEATTASLSLARVHYAQGWIDFDRVNNLQRDFILRQDELIAAQADVALAMIRVYRTLGGGWELDSRFLKKETEMAITGEPETQLELPPLNMEHADTDDRVRPDR